jgi:16S rRNA G966 N2-methylase RsmD
MYTPRALLVYARLWNEKLPSRKSTALFRFCLSSINNYVSRKQGYFGGGGGVAGTLFTPSIHLERNVFDVLLRKIDKVGSLKAIVGERISVSTQSVIDLRNVPGQSVDYIFTDPPFGESLQYAELNLFAESWLGVRTVVEDDCVLNYVHHKDLAFYSHMMVEAFRECARILKPGKWMTIEFHNSQNAVWNVIQRAIEISGLVVADVRILDKQQQSFNAVNRAGAVDQDLIISAYKPRAGFERRFLEQAGTEEGAWAFVRQHLEQLPVAVEKEGALEIVAERQAYLLYDRMVAFHIQRGCSVPLGAAEFYAGLKRRFPERDGMYFLRAQAAEYDRRRLKAGKVEQLALFVSDEKSAIQWLQRELNPNTGNGPQTYQDLVPKFMRELHQARHEKLPELSDILAQGFLKDDAERWYIPNPERQEDLEKLRERALLHEFLEYLPARSGGHAGRLKVFRTEAVRAGFKHSWAARDYSSIVRVAQRLPESVLQEDAGLLMYYDNALLRMEEQPVQGQLL